MSNQMNKLRQERHAPAWRRRIVLEILPNLRVICGFPSVNANVDTLVLDNQRCRHFKKFVDLCVDT